MVLLTLKTDYQILCPMFLTLSINDIFFIFPIKMELLVWKIHLYERLTYVKKMQVFILLTTNIFILCQML